MEESRMLDMCHTVRPTQIEERSSYVVRNTFIERVFDDSDDDADGKFVKQPAFSDPLPLSCKSLEAAVPQQSNLCVDKSEYDIAIGKTIVPLEETADDTDGVNDVAPIQYPQWQNHDLSLAWAPTCTYSYCVAPVLWPVAMFGCCGEATPSPEGGFVHSFHREVHAMGSVSEDFRRFTKEGYEGRLSVVSESRVHDGGVHRYLVQFASGNLSKADGVGFVFSPTLPCKKNIQRIVSVFINQRGRICMRVCEDILRASARVRALKCGDWVEMIMDLDRHTVSFSIWPDVSTIGTASPVAEFDFGRRLEAFYGKHHSKNVPDLSTGHLACVIKNEGVTVVLGS